MYKYDNYNNHIGESLYTNEYGSFYHSSFNLDWIDWEPKVIFDIGFFDLGDSVRFKKRWPNCKIYAFELLTDNYIKIVPIAEKIGIKVYNKAIANYCGTTKFWIGKSTSGVNAQSTLLEPGQQYKDNYSHHVSHEKSEYEVECITLEQFCKEENITEIDLLHVDTDGGEHLVFQGFVSVRPKMVFYESLLSEGWIGQPTLEEIDKILTDMGYEIVSRLPHDNLAILKE